jgi:histidine triad (HIT) family protein
MYSHEPEGYVCPLCQIARGEPTNRGSEEDSIVFRDGTLTAFIAGKWWRSAPGHVIIVPNAHIENLYDMPEEIGHRIFDLSKKIALGLKETYGCEGVSTRQHNEPAGNQDVWHYHLHIYPRSLGDDFYIHFKDTYWPTMDEKRPYAEKLRKYLGYGS